MSLNFISDDAYTYFIQYNSEKITLKQFFIILNTSQLAIFDFCNFLATLPYESIFWECPNKFDEIAQFHITPTNSFANIRASYLPFQQYIENAFEKEETVAVFPNLSKDSILIAPTDITASYKDLLSFIRLATDREKAELWYNVAKNVLFRLNKGYNCYVSTHGLGVYWLHIRLDTSPKYYVHNAYK